MLKQLVPALRMTMLLTVLTGLIYPGVVTGVCQVLFHDRAHGSLIEKNGQIVGQNFTKPEYFHPRPSAAGNDGYDPTASGGSNLGPTSQKLYDRVKVSVEQFRKENPNVTGPVPADAVTASASGLDPDISLDNARAQSTRVAQARNMASSAISNLIASSVTNRGLGLLGEPRVNVLHLNLLLDEKFAKR
jgi:K+-transporting ATPase ATPase C chain